MPDSALSLVPPVLAILLVIATRRVLPSLGAGILAGLLLLHRFDPFAALQQLITVVAGIFAADGGVNTDKVYNLAFLVFLGMTASLVTVCGGSRAFGEWAVRRVTTRRGASLVPAVLGLVLFIDDYFNALVVGNVSRPLTDRHRISRAKLAYLVDSTSAPVCVLTPISSWGAYIISVLAGIFAAHGMSGSSSLAAFVRMAPMNYYAICTLLALFAVALLRIDFGPMRRHEQRALRGEGFTSPGGEATTGQSTAGEATAGETTGDAERSTAPTGGKIRDLVAPIAVLVVATVAGMVVTGFRATEGPASALSVFENTDVPTALLFGSVLGWITAMVLSRRRAIPGRSLRRGLRSGIRSMTPAIWILLFAWTLIEVVDALGTGDYLAGLVRGRMDFALLPMVLFLLAGFMAFSTGTSWGTFGVVLPIAGDIAAATDPRLMLPALAAVLGGAIFGDHCSPISDTTILSSAGAQVRHIDHVVTQLPYAVGVSAIAAAGYLVLGLTGSAALGLLCSVLLLTLAVALLAASSSRPAREQARARSPYPK